MQVSVIVPVFNEAPLIRRFLAHLRERAPEAEIIVVDGASTDGSDRLAAGFCAQVVRTGECGRAQQMNAGARAAGGDILWFRWDVWMRLAASCAIQKSVAVTFEFACREAWSTG
jgi:glycosyltransferase involved in cell wall biosynthesis